MLRPIVAHPGSVLLGGWGDVQGVVWAIWARARGLFESSTISMFGAPYGVPNSGVGLQPIYEFLLRVVSKWFGEVAGFNLLVFVSFPVTAYATFLFLARLIGDRPAAFLGGLIFGFCPAAVFHAAAGHLTFALNLFLPAFLAALFFNRDRRSLFSSALLGMSYAMLTLTCLYWGYYSLFIGCFFFAFDFWTSERGMRSMAVRSYLPAVILSGGILICVLYPALHLQVTAGTETLHKMGRIRDPYALVVYSARFREYFLPPSTHPVFGRWAASILRAHLHESNVFEQTLYLGLIPIALCLVGFVLASRGDLPPSRRTYFLFFTGGVAWMAFVSAPPFFRVESHRLPTLSYFMYRLAPMFRVYSRAGLIAVLFLAGAVAVVVAHLRSRLRKPWNDVLVVGSSLFLVFEYWCVPPGFFQKLETPPVYQWLARQPGDIIIAEYPMWVGDELPQSTYLFWQRAHGKRMVNGAIPSSGQAWDLSESVRDLSNPAVVGRLKEAGVSYVIVHGKGYSEGRIPAALKPYFPSAMADVPYDDGKPPVNALLPSPGMRFGSDVVYRLGEAVGGPDDPRDGRSR
jgi:hypothetical protein